MTMQVGTWRFANQAKISIRTSRIGLLSIHAHAPVVEGELSVAADAVALEFIVAINQVSTGNPLLDPEVHALVNSGSNGKLTFRGTGRTLDSLSGHATAGKVTVPLELGAQPRVDGDNLPLAITGRTTFRDIHIPLPGMGHIRHVDVDIESIVTLLHAAASG